MELRGKSNPELLKLYDVELVLRLHNARNLKDTRRLLDKFTIFLAGQHPSAVQAKAFLAGYAGRQPRTVYRYLQMLRPFLKWCGDPITDLKIKIPKSLPPYTDDSQVESLRAQVRNKKSHKSLIERDLLLIDTAGKTGMRRGDLANLAKSDIHDDFIIVRKGKGQKDRVIPLAKPLATRLHSFTKNMAPHEKVFKLTAVSIGNKFEVLAKKAGVDIHTHSMRHKFATDLFERHVNPRVVQELMGHENLNTTQQYASISDQSLKDAINRLEGPPTAKSSQTIETPAFETSLVLEVGPDAKSIASLEIADFNLELPGPAVTIERLQVRTSDTSLPFRLFVFEHRPETGEDIAKEDVSHMEIARQRTVTWPAGASVFYQNADGRSQLYGAIAVGHRDRWAVVRETKNWKDITPELSPATFTISLRCHPASIPNKQ
ncbi:MAG TPA: tyrosine-type recombinase/integrase [Dehalococcoidales bacterium]